MRRKLQASKCSTVYFKDIHKCLNRPASRSLCAYFLSIYLGLGKVTAACQSVFTHFVETWKQTLMTICRQLTLLTDLSIKLLFAP